MLWNENGQIGEIVSKSGADDETKSEMEEYVLNVLPEIEV